MQKQKQKKSLFSESFQKNKHIPLGLIQSSLNLAFPKPFSFFDVHYGLNESGVVTEACYHSATTVL